MINRITGTEPIGLDTLENIAFKINDFCTKNKVNPYIISHTFIKAVNGDILYYTALLTWEKVTEHQTFQGNFGPGRQG